MKKELLIATAAFIFAATPVFAAPSQSNNGSDKRVNVEAADTNHEPDNDRGQNPVITQPVKHEDKADLDDQDVSPRVSPTTTAQSTTPCDKDENFKNHGKFVSCVAHLHVGGEEVAEAAHSDIGKHNENKPTPSVTVTPTATPSVSPTTTPTVSPTPISSAMGTFFGGIMPIKNLGLLISRFVDFIKHLI